MTLVVIGENLNLSAADTALEYDWKLWEAQYIKNPTGEIVKIRLKLNS